jgi:hypothetical protein
LFQAFILSLSPFNFSFHTKPVNIMIMPLSFNNLHEIRMFKPMVIKTEWFCLDPSQCYHFSKSKDDGLTHPYISIKDLNWELKYIHVYLNWIYYFIKKSFKTMYDNIWPLFIHLFYRQAKNIVIKMKSL